MVHHSLAEEVYPRLIVHAMEASTVFISVWVVASVILGYTIGLSFAAPLAGVVAVLAWIRTSNEKLIFVKSNVWIAPLVVFLFVAIAASGVFWGIQGGYDLSADAAPSIAAEFIGEKIPFTYQPYFDVPFIYQLGLPILVAQLPTSLPTYVWGWVIGTLSLGLLIFWSGRWAYYFTRKKDAIIWASILILGMRLPYLNLLVGEYPWLFALGLGLGVVWLVRQSWVWGGIGFAALGIIHPYIAVNFFLFWLIADAPTFMHGVKTISIAAVGMSLIILHQVLPTLSASGGGGFELPTFNTISAIPSLLGFTLFVCGLVTLLVERFVWKKDRKTTIYEKMVGIGLFAYCVASFFPSLSAATKLLELSSISLVFGLSAWASENISPKHLNKAVTIVVIFSLLIAGFSGDLRRLADGSKSTLREAKFATQLDDFFPNGARVLFMADGPNKMAQYSHTNPIAPTNAHFISVIAKRNTKLEGVKKLLKDEEIISRARDENCTTCLSEISAEWVVIDSRTFPIPSGITCDLVQDEWCVMRASELK